MTSINHTFRFTGHITAVTGLTVTRPDETFASPTNSPFRLSRKAGRLPRMGALREDSPAYFPATTLRGAIRRAGRNMIRRHVIKETGNPTPWSVDTHYMLTQGVDTTNKTLTEKASGAIGLETSLRNENPFLSLFGRWKLPGHLGIDNAIPENPEGAECLYVEGRGARSADFERDTSQIEFLSPDEAKKLKRILEQDSLAAQETSSIDIEIKKLKVDFRNALDNDEKTEVKEQIKCLEDRKKAVKSAKEGSQESIQRPLEGFEAIKPGTRMHHRMIVQNAPPIELGLFLGCLREFARNPYVGGHRALNCGEINAKWEVQFWPEDSDAPIRAGTVNVSSEGFEISNESPEELLSEALTTWDRTAKALAENGVNFERYLLVE